MKMLTELESLIQRVQLLGFGDAVHGASEPTVLRQKVLEGLVREHGFNGLIIEAPLENIKPANEFILTGDGNGLDVVRKLDYWMYMTQEFLDVVKWLRTYNLENPDRQVTLHGCDISESDPRRKSMTARDQAMAEECFRILDKDPQNKFALWAHNFHISDTETDKLISQGHVLREKLGGEYFNFANLIGFGKFHAVLWKEDGGFGEIQEFKLDKPKQENYEYLFLETEVKDGLMDIRNIKGFPEIAKIREVGSAFNPQTPEEFEQEIELRNSYDGVMWIREVTPSKLL